MAYMNNGIYPQYPMAMNYQRQSQIMGRQVSSVDEAKAAQIDFDGSLFVFPDVAHGYVYTKQVALDGTAPLKTYKLVEEQSVTQYVTRQEFSDAMAKLTSHIDGMEASINGRSKKADAGHDGEVSSF